MKMKVWRMASLVAMVAAGNFIAGCAGPDHRPPGARPRTTVTPISMDGGQPESRRRSLSITSVIEGDVATITLLASSNVTVAIKGYITSVVHQDDETNLTLDVPGSLATTNFATGTYAGHTLFDGNDSCALTANTPRTIYFKIQNISSTTQFTIFALNSGGTHGGAYNFVATPQ